MHRGRGHQAVVLYQHLGDAPAVLVHLRQFKALDLAARGPGDLVDEDDPAVEPLVRGESAGDEGVDFVGREARAAPAGVGFADDECTSGV